MGPNTLPPSELEEQQPRRVWPVALAIFVVGLGAGVMVPPALSYLGIHDLKLSLWNRHETPKAAVNKGKASRHEAAQPVLNIEATEEKLARQEPKAKAIASLPAPSSKTRKEERASSQDARKLEKEPVVSRKQASVAAARKKTISSSKAVAKAEEKPALARRQAAPSNERSEPAPVSLPPARMPKAMPALANRAKQKNLARAVSLPPSAALMGSAVTGASPLPLMKSSGSAGAKTYAVSINNASFMKAGWNECAKRCALLAVDPSGNPVKAIFDGSAYAEALSQHNGTINISGQPKLIKNQQYLLVENITFNLSASQKAAKRNRGVKAAAPSELAGYTEVSYENDDLKPGTVIKDRQQIPMDEQEIPAP